MRDSVRKLVGDEVAGHVGLAYTTLAPVGEGGKVPAGDQHGKDAKDSWLEKLTRTSIGPEYHAYVDAWLASFPRTAAMFKLTLNARLLIGHGNTSGTDVGLTVHHTWGVPIVPGSALKGILANYVASTYGPEPSEAAPDSARDPWRGVGWKDNAIIRGPGELYRALFGAPDAADDRVTGGSASRGHVIFHDALYLGLAPEHEVSNQGTEDRKPIAPDSEPTSPFAADVLTVHQKDYYDRRGADWPCDYDDPNPVGFLTIRPRAQFVVVLEGPADWTDLAGRMLGDALSQRGIGGKTSSGYGRGTLLKGTPPPAAAVADLRGWLKAARKSGHTQAEILARIRDEQLQRLLTLSPDDRAAVAAVLRTAIDNDRLTAQREELCAELTAR
jgi:CRISPR-associated protein Cmr6